MKATKVLLSHLHSKSAFSPSVYLILNSPSYSLRSSRTGQDTGYNSKLTYGKKPIHAASWIGVNKLKLSRVGSAPASSRAATTPFFLHITAVCRAVLPSMSCGRTHLLLVCRTRLLKLLIKVIKQCNRYKLQVNYKLRKASRPINN